MVTQSLQRMIDGWLPPRLVLIGFGMQRSDLSQAAEAWIARAQVLAGGGRILDAFPEHPGKRVLIRSPIHDSLLDVERLARDYRVAVLASGDPFFFGIGKALVESSGAERILALANITSVQALFSRLARPWQDVRVSSLHGRNQLDWIHRVKTSWDVALLTDDRHTPSWIAGKLIEAGLGHCQMAIGEDLGLPSEAVRVLPATAASSMEFSRLNIVAVFANLDPARNDPGKPNRDHPGLGIEDASFSHRAGLITKREIRAVVLALLQLKGGQVLWDIGAGSGSVGIESARLVRLKSVTSIERHPDRYRDLVENIERFDCKEITPIAADALAVVGQLAAPDRVFIGGSGGELERLLEIVRSRLRPGGRVVQTAVTFETLARARAFWRASGWNQTVTQVQVSRSVAIGNSERLDALNPVFILDAWPEANRRSISEEY